MPRNYNKLADVMTKKAAEVDDKEEWLFFVPPKDALAILFKDKGNLCNVEIFLVNLPP